MESDLTYEQLKDEIKIINNIMDHKTLVSYDLSLSKVQASNNIKLNLIISFFLGLAISIFYVLLINGFQKR